MLTAGTQAVAGSKPAGWARMLGEVGFPILVAAFVLYRVEDTLRELVRVQVQSYEVLRSIAERPICPALALVPPGRTAPPLVPSGLVDRFEGTPPIAACAVPWAAEGAVQANLLASGWVARPAVPFSEMTAAGRAWWVREKDSALEALANR